MKRRGVIPLILVIVTLATFGRIASHEFTGWDDAMTIFENPRIVSPSLENVVFYWTHSEGGLYVPVTYTFWSVLAAMSQVNDGQGHVALNPWPFHAASVALHVLAVLVAYQILRLLIDHDIAAMFGALLFAVHPMQVEAVAWTSGAKDLLGGLFSLVAIWQYLKFAIVFAGGRDPASPFNKSKVAREHFISAAIALVIAMLSKPSAVTVPLIAGAIDYFIIRRPIRRIYSSILPLVLLTIPFVIVGRNVQTAVNVTDAALWTRPLVALDALAFYVFKLFWPATLGIIYGRTPDAILKNGQIYYTWIVPIVLIAAGYALRRRWPMLPCAECVFAFAVLPVLGLTAFMFQVHSTVADHYVYVAMLGVGLLAADVLRRWASVWLYGLMSVLLAALVVKSTLQAGIWKDSVTLMLHAVEVTPASATAHSNLGLALAGAGRLDDALPQLELAVRIDSENRNARSALAQAYLFLGRPREAIEQAEIAIRLLTLSGENTDRAMEIRNRALAALFKRDLMRRMETTSPATQSNQP